MTTATACVPRSRMWLRGTTTLLCLALSACSSDILSSTTPGYGFIRLAVSMTGGDPDRDGYYVMVDGARAARLEVASWVQSFSMREGAHTLELGELAPNCTVAGPTPLDVDVVAGQVVSLSIEVACVATGIAVTVRTEGPDIPASVRVAVDESPPVAVKANGTQTIGYLTAGSHTLTLLEPAHCTVAGGDRISVTVVAATISPVAFSVTCAPVTRRERIAYVDAPLAASAVMWIELVDIDGSNAERLERGEAPTWSQHGRELAYSDARCVAAPSYYLEYWGETFCTGGLIIQDPETRDIRRPMSNGSAFNPAWSPARDEIAFEGANSWGGGSGLGLFDLARFVVTPISIYGPQSITEPAWSPDGERVVFVCTWAGPIPTSDLCAVKRDGTGFVRLTNDEDREGRPAWSPDGATLAFERKTPGGGASSVVVLRDLATGRVTTLGAGSHPAWSPDGSKLVFASTDGLFVMNADGTDRKRLTTGRHYAPAWRPS